MLKADRYAGQSKQAAIVSDIRAQIVQGKLQPGQALPSSKNLQRRYAVTPVTVSRATRRLSDAGYLVSKERQGVYVATSLPHLTRFGIAFYGGPDTRQEWPRFFDVIYREAQHPFPEHGASFELYTHLRRGQDSTDYQRLVADLQLGRIGGVLFVSDPWELSGSSLFRFKEVPLMAVAPPGRHPRVHAVVFAPLFDRVVTWCREQGRRRLAVVQSAVLSRDAEQEARLFSMVDAAGIELPRRWLQYADQRHPAMVGNLLQLLLGGNADDRPDALFLGDDNLLAEADIGIVNSGLHVPEDLAVISHSNLPSPTRCRLPISLIGYDVRGLLGSAIETFRAMQRGQPPGVTVIPPIFESEIPNTDHAGVANAE